MFLLFLILLQVAIVPVQSWCPINSQHIFKTSVHYRLSRSSKVLSSSIKTTPDGLTKHDIKQQNLSLTNDNVEIVLNTVRPYLESDGGNVKLVGIDNGVVKLTLQGACRSCPSSVNTMKFGLEKALKKAIPSIIEVVNVDNSESTSSPPKVITILSVDGVLNQLRPFIAAAGGKIRIIDLKLNSGDVPDIILQLEGACSGFKSIKTEIVSRIHNHFRTTSSTLNIQWSEGGVKK